jgi:hypothetical protein
MIRRAIAAAACGTMVACALLASPRETALADPVRDVLIRKAFIPSEKRIHGELRLVKRGGAMVLQTLLYSRFLRLGLDSIRSKELYYWPPSQPGHEDSARYLAAIESAKKNIFADFDAREDKSDPRQKMLIEFVLSKDDASFAVCEVELDQKGREVTIRSRKPLVVERASRAYIARAMKIQADNGFKAAVPELEEALKSGE